MADPYARSRATAARLINKYGRTVQIRQKITYGPSHTPVVMNEDTPVKATVAEAVTNEARGVQMGDKRFTMVTDIELSTIEGILDGNTEYSIVQVRDTKPGDTSIVKTVWGRN